MSNCHKLLGIYTDCNLADLMNRLILLPTQMSWVRTRSQKCILFQEQYYYLLTHVHIFAEHEVIPGRQLPPECHAEAHTEYSGSAVRWGLTFHVANAADCCQACLDQAKNSLANEKKCNVWVYCPDAGGCFSPDRYKHREQECWLKQVGSLSEEYLLDYLFIYLIVSLQL